MIIVRPCITGSPMNAMRPAGVWAKIVTMGWSVRSSRMSKLMSVGRHVRILWFIGPFFKLKLGIAG